MPIEKYLIKDLCLIVYGYLLPVEKFDKVIDNLKYLIDESTNHNMRWLSDERFYRLILFRI